MPDQLIIQEAIRVCQMAQRIEEQHLQASIIEAHQILTEEQTLLTIGVTP